jgi:hypothetical protein
VRKRLVHEERHARQRGKEHAQRAPAPRREEAKDLGVIGRRHRRRRRVASIVGCGSAIGRVAGVRLISIAAARLRRADGARDAVTRLGHLRLRFI